MALSVCRLEDETRTERVKPEKRTIHEWLRCLE
jgi:hypothetical protein